MPTVDFGSLTMMTLVAGDHPPADLLGLAGLRILLTDDMVASLPSALGSISAGGTTVPGFKKVMPDGSIQWVMTTVDPNLAMLEALPGPGGWRRPESRDTWASIGLEVRKRGVTPPEVDYAWPVLFAAAKAEVLAQLPPTIRVQLNLT